MKRAVFPLSILAALVFSFAGNEFLSTAQAQTARPGTAVCKRLDSLNPGKLPEVIEAWMTEQLAAGRTQFLHEGVLFCAW